MNEYKKEKIRNIHYNNKNEIQFEYGGQVHHYRMETLKEVFVNCWNLQQENEQLKDNWNKSKECLKDVMNSCDTDDKEFVETILDIMQEIEKGE